MLSCHLGGWNSIVHYYFTYEKKYTIAFKKPFYDKFDGSLEVYYLLNNLKVYFSDFNSKFLFWSFLI